MNEFITHCFIINVEKVQQLFGNIPTLRLGQPVHITKIGEKKTHRFLFVSHCLANNQVSRERGGNFREKSLFVPLS